MRNNADATLKISVGTKEDASAYVGETQIVDWIAKKVELLTNELTTFGDNIEAFQFKLTGFEKYSEIRFQFQNEASFMKVGVDDVNKTALSPTMTLYGLLPNSGTEDKIDTDCITVAIRLTASGTTKAEKKSQTLTIQTVTSDNNPSLYLSVINILTWKTDEEWQEDFMYGAFQDLFFGGGGVFGGADGMEE